MNESVGQLGVVPLVEVTRGAVRESVHLGCIAIVDASGGLVYQWGDVDQPIFLRSSAKPFQALPFVESGGPEYFGLDEQEVAILCASHRGTDDHVRVLRGIQKKTGLSEAQLMCGTHWPYDVPTQRAMLLRGEEPTPNRHNCSGKHTGMLAFARMLDAPLESYREPDHPVQREILRTFAEMCQVTPESVIVAPDGCTAPNFAVPLRSAALAYARLCQPDGLEPRRAETCRRITHAMTSFPDMISGPGGFDTELMRAAGGKVVCKGGAEGYQALGILPGALGPGSPAVGITFKILDGDSAGRARPVVALELLRRLGALTEEELKPLRGFDARPVTNFAHAEVGVMRTIFG